MLIRDWCILEHYFLCSLVVFVIRYLDGDIPFKAVKTCVKWERSLKPTI